MRSAIKIVLSIALLSLIIPGKVIAQDTVLTKLTALQSDFVSKIKAAGYKPSLPAPPIVLDNPASFGNYDDVKNVLHSCDWRTMSDDTKAMFFGAAQAFNNGMTAEQFFEMGAHKWIFIHEMGHWWRKCQKQTATHYDEEMAANRLAMAYWRERDPEYFAFMLKWFEGVLAQIPSPVPAGEDKKKYLNDNYDHMAGDAAYTWYQASMILDASKETPVLTFAQAVAKAGN